MTKGAHAEPRFLGAGCLLIIVGSACGPNPRPPPVGSPIAADFTFAVGTSSTTFDFRDTSAGNVTRWRWTFGDGTPAVTAQNPSHDFPGVGSFVVALEVSDGSSRRDTAAKRVTVYGPPPSDFTVRPVGTVPTELRFDGPRADIYGTPLGGPAPAPTIQSWAWDFGDGTTVTSTARSTVHRYGADGTYSVVLVVAGPGGTARSSQDVDVGVVAPVAAFVARASPHDPQTIAFTDASTGDVSSWQWDFGDGARSTDANPTHRYTAGGAYVVALAAAGAGGTHSASETVVVVDAAPRPRITHRPGPAPLEVQLTATASEAVTSWSWDLGDGAGTATGSTTRYTYATPNAYVVKVEAAGPGGVGHATEVLTLGVVPPTVDFTTRAPAQPYTVEIVPRVTGTVAQLELAFGDGDVVTRTPPFSPVRHTYPGAGTYAVTLTVDGAGGPADVTRNVVVVDPPLALSFTVSPAAPTTATAVDFSASATGNVWTWRWDFGDGTRAIGRDVRHLFAAAGTYDVELTADGPTGPNVASKTVVVGWPPSSTVVRSSPTGAFGPLVAPVTIRFEADAVGPPPLAFDWDFQDGGTSRARTPSHTFVEPGTYAVRLTTTDGGNPPRTTQTVHNVTVAPRPIVGSISTNGLTGDAPFELFARDASTGTIDRWVWDFGDGTSPLTTTSSAVGLAVSHTYAAPGRYPLRLTVSGPAAPPGDRGVIETEVVVTTTSTAPVSASIHADPISGGAPLTVSFLDGSIGPYDGVLWDFDDGAVATATSVDHTFAAEGTYRVRLTLLGPPPARAPVATSAEIITVGAGALPGLGPPSPTSSGGFASAAIARPVPGGRGGGGGGGGGLPGAASPTLGPGWPQASALRHDPTAQLTLADGYAVVRATTGPGSTSYDCDAPCATGACGLNLPSPHGANARGTVSVAAATAGDFAYLARTERTERGAVERSETELIQLSAIGPLAVRQRVLLDANDLVTAVSPPLPATSPYLQRDRTSFVVDDLMVLSDATVVLVGRVTIVYDFGGASTLDINERPGLFAISPTSGALQWALLADWTQPGPHDTKEVRANVVGDRFLIWVLDGSATTSSLVDAVLFEGRVPSAGSFLSARKVDDAINDLNLVDFAVGPNDTVYFVVREETPLGCYDETLDRYELVAYDADFDRSLMDPVPLVMDYDPRIAVRHQTRLEPERRLIVEAAGADVRVILNGTTWPDEKDACARYKGSPGHPYPAYGDGCPDAIVRRFCCDSAAVRARNPAVCAGAVDEGACPCRGVDPADEGCPIRYTGHAICRRSYAPVMEHLLLKPGGGGRQSDPAQHTLTAAHGALAGQSFVGAPTLFSDGEGRVTRSGRILRLAPASAPDVDVVAHELTELALTDRGTPRRSLHSAFDTFRVYTHEPRLGRNVEVSYAWPGHRSLGAPLVVPTPSGRLFLVGGDGGLVRLYEPTGRWAGPVFADHRAPTPTVTPCDDDAAACTAYDLFTVPHADVPWPGYFRCGWTETDCRTTMLDLWDHMSGRWTSRWLPRRSRRVRAASVRGLSPFAWSRFWTTSARRPGESIEVGGVQPRCQQTSTTVLETRQVCVDYDQANSRCRRYAPQDRMGIRCEQQREVWLPVLTDVAPNRRGWQRFVTQGEARRCADVGLPSPVLTVDMPGPELTITKSVVNRTGTLTITPPRSAEVHVEIESGDATFASGVRERTFSGSSAVRLTLTAQTSDVVVVRVRSRDLVQYAWDTELVTFHFESPAAPCRPEGNGFRVCTPRHPGPVLTDADQPARHDPAVVGNGVELGTRAYWAEETDAILPSVGMPLVVRRHYIPPLPPTTPSPDPSYNPQDTGAELGPGWRLNLIQWLLPITPDKNPTALETPSNRLDLALHADGRVDVFRHPSTIPALAAVTGDERIFVYDEATGKLVERPLTARVVEYSSPTGFEGILRGYTFVPPTGRAPSDVHPFYAADSDAVGPNERRFFVLTDFAGGMRVFNCKGQLVRIITAQRQAMRFVYAGPVDRNTSLRVLSGVIDTNGRLSRLVWREARSGPRLLSFVLPDGRRIEYVYRGRPGRPRRLASVTRNLRAINPLTTTGSPLDPPVWSRHGYGYTGDDLLRFVYVHDPATSSNSTVLFNGYENGALVWQRTGAAEQSLPSHPVRDGGEVRIQYTTNGAVFVDPDGVRWTHTLGKVGGADSASVIVRTEVDAAVHDGDATNPGVATQTLATVFGHDADGRRTVEDPPGPYRVVEAFNARGDRTLREESAAGMPTRRWRWTPQYRGPCMSTVTAVDPTNARTVIDYFGFDADRPGQICQIDRIREPRVTDALGAHGYQTQFEYFGAHQNASTDDWLLRGAVKTERRTDGTTVVRETTNSYWVEPGRVTASPGRAAYAKLGLPKLTTVRGLVPSSCSGAVARAQNTYREYDIRGNATLIREWATVPAQPEAGPPNPEDALEERRVYDQANRLYSVRFGGVETTYAYNFRGELSEVIGGEQDLFDGATLTLPLTNTPPRSSVVRFLYQHDGQRYATLFGTRRGTHPPEFHSFAFEGHDAAGRQTLSVRAGPGLSDTERLRIVDALVTACPEPKTPSGTSCPMKALDAAGLLRPTIAAADVAEKGAPLRFDVRTYTADGFLATRRLHDGTAGLTPTTGGAFERHYYDATRAPTLTEPGARGRDGRPVRVGRTYNAMGDLTEKAVFDPDGCRSGSGGYTKIRAQRYEDHDAVGRPRRIRVVGDDGRVADVRAASVDASVCSTGRELAKTELSLDEIGRVRTQTDFVHLINPSGLPGSTRQITTELAYGPLGHVVQRRRGQRYERYHRTYLGATCASDVTMGANRTPVRATDLDLDALGRTTRRRTRHRASGPGLGQPSHTVSFAYDRWGRQAVRRDGLDRETKRYFDAAGRLRVEEMHDDVGGLIRQRELVYDDHGNNVRETTRAGADQRGVHRSFSVDHLLEETTTVNRRWRSRRRFVRDHDGRVTKMFRTGLDDDVLIRELDDTGRVTRETTRVGGADQVDKTMTYDALDNVVMLAAVDRARPRSTAWDETKRFRYNGLGDLTHAQNTIADPRTRDTTRNGVVSNVWYARDSLGAARREGTLLFDRGVRVADRENITDVDVDAKGLVRSIDYDDDLHATNEPELEYRYDDADRVTEIDVRSGAAVDKFELRWSGDFVMERQWYEASGGARHVTDFEYDALLRRFRTRHTLLDDRIESRRWFRYDLPTWTRNVSYRRDAGQWVPNADDGLMNYPQSQCAGAWGARFRGGGAASEITGDPCFDVRSPVRVMRKVGWDIVDETGAIGSRFTGEQYDGLGRVLRRTNISYRGRPDERPGVTIRHERMRRVGDRLANRQTFEVGATVSGVLFHEYDWGVRAITDRAYAYEGDPLGSGIRCDPSLTPGLDTSRLRRPCGTREYRFPTPPLTRFPGEDKPFDAINIGVFDLSELKREQSVHRSSSVPNPEAAVYRMRYGAIGQPTDVRDDVTNVDKYAVEYDPFGRQVFVRDRAYRGASTKPVVTHRFLYDAQDRLLYEDYDGIDASGDDITYAPTFYGYYGRDLLREHVVHGSTGEVSDRVFVYGPRGALLYTARMGTLWNPTWRPPIAHLVLEDVAGSPLTFYYQHGADRGHHELGADIRGYKMRNYIVGPSALSGVRDIKEPYKQLDARTRSSPFDEMVYSMDQGFLRSRSAGWRSTERVAEELTRAEWQRQQAEYTLYAVAPAALLGAAVGGGLIGAGLAMGGMAGAGAGNMFAGTFVMMVGGQGVQSAVLAGRVAAEGWTQENIHEAGWIGYGLALDAATLGGNRMLAAAGVISAATMVYSMPRLVDTLDYVNPGHSFAAGTPVWTELGLVGIEEIEPGDRVWSWDEASHALELQPVLRTFEDTASELVVLDVGGDRIEVTPRHLIRTEADGWVEAGALGPSHRVRTAHGPTSVRVHGALSASTRRTFDLDVAGGDTYFVGRARLLAHNNPMRLAHAVASGLKPARGPRIILRMNDRQTNAAIGRLMFKRAGVVIHRKGRLLPIKPPKGVDASEVHGPRNMSRPGEFPNKFLIYHEGKWWELPNRAVQSVMRGRGRFKESFKAMFREGGNHEQLQVQIAAHAHKLGVSVWEIRSIYVTPTRTTMIHRRTSGGWQIGPHNNSSISSWFHNEYLLPRQLATRSRAELLRATREAHIRHTWQQRPKSTPDSGIIMRPGSWSN